MLVPCSFIVISPFPVSGSSPKHLIVSCILSQNHLKKSHVLHDPTNSLEHPIKSLLFPMRHIILSLCSPPSYQFCLVPSASSHQWWSWLWSSLSISYFGELCIYLWLTTCPPSCQGCVSERSEEENPQRGSKVKYSGSCKRKNKVWIAWIGFQLLSCP